MPKRLLRAGPVAAALLLASPGLEGAAAQRAGGMARSARADLADAAQGSYFGAVVSDARGPARPEVRIVVTKLSPNQVRVTSDHPRLPAFTATLTRDMAAIRNAGGGEVFLLDLSKSPRTLTLTVHDASWAGARE